MLQLQARQCVFMVIVAGYNTRTRMALSCIECGEIGRQLEFCPFGREPFTTQCNVQRVRASGTGQGSVKFLADAHLIRGRHMVGARPTRVEHVHCGGKTSPSITNKFYWNENVVQRHARRR